MKIETFDDPAQFAAAVRRAQRAATKQRQPKDERPEVPRAPTGERTGLTTLLTEGWSIEFRPGRGYRLSHYQGRETGWRDSEAECCKEARRL